MSAAQRALIAIVVLIVVAGVVVVGLNLAGGEGETGASVSPSASASASHEASEQPTASASAEPSEPTGGEALAILAEIEQQVEAIRGLEPADIGPPDLITRAELREELEEIFEEEYPPEEQQRDNVALRALGLLEPGQDVAELQLELLGEGVLGFYDDTEKRMVVVTDAGLDAIAKVTYAHEYTHALQDAAFTLDTLEVDVEGADDRGLARTALVEGDAQTTMFLWLFQHLTPEEQVSLGQMPLPDTSGIPSWMVAQIDFPYTAGQNWVAQLAGPDPFAPDFAEVDAAFADPPTSTEQIIDINAWRAREEPIPVELPDLAAGLGDGWEQIDSTPVGQATIGMILEHFGVEFADAGLASDGWGGDRVVIASGPDDAFAVAWRLVWDGAVDAVEFADAYGNVVTALDFPASVTSLADGSVLVVHASTQALHDATVTIAAP